MGDAFSDAYDAELCTKCGSKVKYPPCYICELNRKEEIELAKPWEQRYKELKKSTDAEIKHLQKTLDKLRDSIKKAHDNSFSGNW